MNSLVRIVFVCDFVRYRFDPVRPVYPTQRVIADCQITVHVGARRHFQPLNSNFHTGLESFAQTGRPMSNQIFEP